MASKNNAKVTATVPNYVIAEHYEVPMFDGRVRTFDVADTATPLPFPENREKMQGDRPGHVCQVVGCGTVFYGKYVSTFCNPCWTFIKAERQKTGYRPTKGGSGIAVANRIAELEKALAAANAKLEKTTAPAKPKTARKAPAKPAATAPATETPAVS